MARSLKGSYVETCSGELMCPCNLSFDHGATYDYCRVTLVGEIEGTNVAGLKIAAATAFVSAMRSTSRSRTSSRSASKTAVRCA